MAMLWVDKDANRWLSEERPRLAILLQTQIWSLIQTELADNGHSWRMNPKTVNQLGGQVNAETQNAGKNSGDIAGGRNHPSLGNDPNWSG